MRMCPSYHLAGASPLPLDVRYLLKVAPVPHSCRSSAYHLAGASTLPLDVGYLLTAAPAMRSHSSDGSHCSSSYRLLAIIQRHLKIHIMKQNLCYRSDWFLCWVSCLVSYARNPVVTVSSIVTPYISSDTKPDILPSSVFFSSFFPLLLPFLWFRLLSSLLCSVTVAQLETSQMIKV